MHDELQLFFNWLLELIKDQDIDLLLVAGDIFDYANPAAEDRKMYYEFLRRLIDTNTKVIITGGNHDSAGFLDAPKEIFEALDIQVIGGATENIEDEIVEVKDEEGNIILVVAAVPFLKDKDLRHRDQAHKYENRTEEIRDGIKKHYHKLATIIEQKYEGIPSIAMGHLYAIGADPSDSERDIHMGNAAAISSSAFSETYDYVALGHIHRPQVIGKNPYHRYSGSPVALSFSEKKDLKSIVQLKLVGTRLEPPVLIEVPKTRDLLRITGSLAVVSQALADFTLEQELPSFLELIVKEEVFSSSVLAEFEELKQSYSEHKGFRIIKDKVVFEKGARDLTELYQESISVQELKPQDVFSNKLASEDMDDEMSKMLNEAFLELLDSVLNAD